MPRSDLVGIMKRFTAEEQRLVTFTITTHKRLHSFIPCFRSFLENCLDREQYIKEYLVVDDGSSPADRAAMRRAFPPERFPLVRFVFHDKGHPTSINTLLGHVTTPLWLAWEDDWELRTPTPLVGRAMAVLSAEPRVMQVGLNGGWEDFDGSHKMAPADGHGVIRFSVLDYPPSHLKKLTPESVARGCCRPGDAAWPLFSLQPALNRADYIKALGRFTTDWRANMQPRYFVWELEFATRFVAGGAQKAVLGQPHATEREGTVSASAQEVRPSGASEYTKEHCWNR